MISVSRKKYTPLFFAAIILAVAHVTDSHARRIKNNVECSVQEYSSKTPSNQLMSVKSDVEKMLRYTKACNGKAYQSIPQCKDLRCFMSQYRYAHNTFSTLERDPNLQKTDRAYIENIKKTILQIEEKL